jgi:hypothetical protein
MKTKLSSIIILAGLYCTSILTSCDQNNPQPNPNPSSPSSNLWVAATPFPCATGSHTGSGIALTMITSMVTFNNELIVAGDFTAIGGIVAHSIAKWNGVNWSNIGTGNLLNEKVTDMVVYNNKLYFTAGKLYEWDGTVLNEFNYINPNTNFIGINGTDLHVFNNELYIIGDNYPSSGIFKYDGINVAIINTPISQEQSDWNTNPCLGDFNNKLFYGDNKGLFQYENSTWINVNGTTTSPPAIIDIETYNNELYVLGYFNSIGGLAVNNLAKYNGVNWTNVTSPLLDYIHTYPLSSYNIGLNHLKVINNELYLAHTSNSSNSLSSPVIKFNGSQWNTIALNVSSYGGTVHYYNNNLYCGGAMMGVWANPTSFLGNFVKLN